MRAACERVEGETPCGRAACNICCAAARLLTLHYVKDSGSAKTPSRALVLMPQQRHLCLIPTLRSTEGVNVATGPCVSVAEGVADSEAHKRMICECDLALQFITQSDAIFSSSADTIFHAFSTEAMHNVWPIAEKYLHDGESLVTGAAWASTFVAFQAGTPGAVVGFKTKVPPDLSAQKLCDVLVSPDCKVHVHIGSVLQVAERNMVAMFAIKAK